MARVTSSCLSYPSTPGETYNIVFRSNSQHRGSNYIKLTDNSGTYEYYTKINSTRLADDEDWVMVEIIGEDLDGNELFNYYEQYYIPIDKSRATRPIEEERYEDEMFELARWWRGTKEPAHADGFNYALDYDLQVKGYTPVVNFRGRK